MLASLQRLVLSFLEDILRDAEPCIGRLNTLDSLTKLITKIDRRFDFDGSNVHQLVVFRISSAARSLPTKLSRTSRLEGLSPSGVLARACASMTCKPVIFCSSGVSTGIDDDGGGGRRDDDGDGDGSRRST